MICPQLAGILAHWLKPPRRHAKGISTRGAKATLENWALENVTGRIKREMKTFSPNFYSPPAEVTEEMLLNTHLKDDIKLSKELMPTFWETMTTLARTPRQVRTAKYKDHEPVSRYMRYETNIYSLPCSASSWSRRSFNTIGHRRTVDTRRR